MDIYVVSLVLVLIINVMLGLGVWLQAPNRRVNQVFAGLVLALVVWSATGFYDQTADITADLFKALIDVPFVAGAFMIYFISLFSLYFPETRPNSRNLTRRVVWILSLALIPLIVVTIFFPETLISKVTTSNLGNNVVPGAMYVLFPIYYLSGLIFALVNLFKKFRHNRDEAERSQLGLIFTGFGLTMGIALLTNIILPILANNPTLSRFGYLSTLILVSCIGYAIINHRLFDFRWVVARSVAYLLLLATLTLLYTVTILGVFSIFLPGRELTVSQNIIFVASSIIISFTLPPLRRFFRRVTDRFFYRDHYDAQALLDRVSSIFATELELKPLMVKCLGELTSTMRLSSAELIVLDGGKIYEHTIHGKMNALTADALLHFRHPLIVADHAPAGALKRLLSDLGVQVSLQLRAHGETVGYLLLGDKQSGSVFSSNDLAVLEIMRKELAVAVANAKAYDEIAQFNVTLQQRILDATKRLKVANKNLRALDKTKDEFISMASHQLGTPLTAITGYLSMALQNDKKNMTEDQREFVGYALEAAEKMVYMSGDMLNVSRLNSGRFMIQRQPTELVRMIEQELHQLQPTAARKGLSLTNELPKEPVTATLDESKTRQVIMNFIDNALYYTQEGGVHVKLVSEPGKITFTVTDTGMGVPKEAQSKLFAKFYRADNAKSVRPDGTGLGLYLAKRVVEDQGGRLIFASEEGKGSTFGFVLPV